MISGYENRYQSASETHDERMWFYRWVSGGLIGSIVFSIIQNFYFWLLREKCDFLVSVHDGVGHSWADPVALRLVTDFLRVEAYDRFQIEFPCFSDYMIRRYCARENSDGFNGCTCINEWTDRLSRIPIAKIVHFLGSLNLCARVGTDSAFLRCDVKNRGSIHQFQPQCFTSRRDKKFTVALSERKMTQ